MALTLMVRSADRKPLLPVVMSNWSCAVPATSSKIISKLMFCSDMVVISTLVRVWRLRPKAAREAT